RLCANRGKVKDIGPTFAPITEIMGGGRDGKNGEGLRRRANENEGRAVEKIVVAANAERIEVEAVAENWRRGVDSEDVEASSPHDAFDSHRNALRSGLERDTGRAIGAELRTADGGRYQRCCEE